MNKGFLAIVTLSAAMWMHGAMAQTANPAPSAPTFAEACGRDIQQYCADVQRGGGRILRCLRDHKEKLSSSCKTAFAAAMSRPERKN